MKLRLVPTTNPTTTTTRLRRRFWILNADDMIELGPFNSLAAAKAICDDYQRLVYRIGEDAALEKMAHLKAPVPIFGEVFDVERHRY